MQHSKQDRPSDLYTVAIAVGNKLYLYAIFSADHQDALQQAAAKHAERFGSLLSGTRILVHGPCRHANCNCGKDRVVESFTTPNAGPALC